MNLFTHTHTHTHTHIYILYIYSIPILTKSRWQQGITWLSLSRHLFISSIAPSWSSRLCPHRGDVRMSLLVGNIVASICRNLWENVTYVFIFAFSAEFRMSCLSWMVCEMAGRCPYNCFFVGYYQDLFGIARNILVFSPSSFFSMHLLVSTWCIHTVVLTQPRLGEIFFSFISEIPTIWSIT